MFKIAGVKFDDLWPVDLAIYAKLIHELLGEGVNCGSSAVKEGFVVFFSFISQRFNDVLVDGLAPGYQIPEILTDDFGC